MIVMATTNMQARLRYKHASEPVVPLDGDPTVDANLTLKPSHHLAESFKPTFDAYTDLHLRLDSPPKA
jgi:hypothetical protein